MPASLRFRTILGLGLLTLAACGESPALPKDLATAEVTEDVALTQASFESEQATALVELGTRIDAALVAAGGGATLASVVASGPVPGPRLGLTRQPALMATLDTVVRTPAKAIPSGVLGRTFAWDATDGRYELTTREGAPANGVRFVLYRLNPRTLEPAEPLVEVGTVTIVQGGSTAAPIATVIARDADSTTVFEYTATRGGTTTVPAFTINGTAGTGPNASTFTLSVGINLRTQTVTADWRTAILSRSLTTRTTLGINPNTGAVSLNGRMQRGLRRVDIVGTFNNALSGQLTVRVGDQLFARLELDGPDVVNITGADGAPLGAEEATALRQVFEWFSSTLTWYSVLLDPVYAALGIE